MSKIRKGDKVKVIAGKSKGTVGEVMKVLPKNRLIVQGVQLVKKHVKPNPNVQEPGGIKSVEAPIHASNVALHNPNTDKADRVGFKFLEEAEGKSKKVRYFKSDNELVDIA